MSESLKKFVKENKKIWKDKSYKNTEKGIYFENITESYYPLMMGKFLTAKGLQSRFKSEIFAFQYKIGKEYRAVCNSFGIKPIGIFKNIKLLDICSALVHATILYFKNLMGMDFLKYIYKDVLIGDLIYDHIIRIGNKCTIGRSLGLQDISVIMKGFLIANLCERTYIEKPPVYFVAGDLIYLNGIMVRFALKHKAKIAVATTGKKSYIYPEEKIFKNYKILPVDLNRSIVENRLKEEFEIGWEDKVEQYLQNIYRGIGDWNTENAYKNKLAGKKQEVLQKIGIRNKKKNIVIMPHCFSDAPHCASVSLYKDYYVWLVETLEIISQIKNINWIIKEHPCNASYGEEGIVGRLYDKYRKEKNIYWLPNEYSTIVVPEIADAIMTVRGTAGIEMSCQGIRCVVAGLSFYSGGPFVYNPKSVKEYECTLRNLDKVTHLTEEEILCARKTLFAAFDYLLPIQEAYQELSRNFYEDFRKDNSSAAQNIEKYFGALLELNQRRPITESYWYQWGRKNGKPVQN